MYGFRRMATASASNPRLRDQRGSGWSVRGRSTIGDLFDGMTAAYSPSRTWDREQHDWETEFGVLRVQSAYAA